MLCLFFSSRVSYATDGDIVDEETKMESALFALCLVFLIYICLKAIKEEEASE